MALYPPAASFGVGVRRARATHRDTADPDARPSRAGESPERIVAFDLRSVAAALGVVLGVGIGVKVALLAHRGLVLIAIATFLAVALDPAVTWFERRRLGRGRAVATVLALAAAASGLVILVLLPPLVEQVGHFVAALPSLVAQATTDRGPLGSLEARYHVIDRLRSADTTAIVHDATSALGAARSVAVSVFSAVMIGFLTLFMLLEGPRWLRRAIELTPERSRPMAGRICAGVYRCVAGFVMGNVVASVLAGIVATAIMLAVGVPYALPLGLLVAIVDLVPFVGPIVATFAVSAVALAHGAGAALIVLGLLVAYHLVEGHTLRPLLYGRATALSPLTVLVSLVLCVEVFGILGAVAAIPIAGAVGVVLTEIRTADRPSQDR